MIAAFAIVANVSTKNVLINGWNIKNEFYWDYMTLGDYNRDYASFFIEEADNEGS